MIEKALFYGIISLVVLSILSWLNKAAKIKIYPDKTGETTLIMNKLYLILGIIVLMMWTVFVIFTFISMTNDWVAFFTTFLIISIVTLGPGIPCILWYLNHKVTFDNDVIQVRNVYGKQQNILFKDIVSTNMNNFSGLLKVSTQNRSVSIHQHLIGVTTLTEKIKSYTT